MAAISSPAQARPEARAFRVEDLLAYARAGRIRVPAFQRGFKWDRDDVQKLIDSIWRGYPIGALLLWSKVGEAGRVSLGELVFEVGEQNNAWLVVDGQQRIGSLVSTLLPRGKRGEKFDLYFDLEASDLDPSPVVPLRRSSVPPTHLPLNRVVDSEELLAWIDEHRAALTPEQVRLALRVGKVLREYELPAYVVTVNDEAVVREIFSRTNSSGKSLDVSDVFNALHAPPGRQPAVSLEDVAQRLRVRSLGELDEDQLLRGLLAIAQKDLAGDLQRRMKDVDIPVAIDRVERAMDRVLGFLAQDAGIPHLRLLPDQTPLTVLSAYFDRFPTPSGRARRLLTRWLWRGVVTGELRGDGKGVRPALEALRSSRSDEMTARDVLATVSTRRPVLETSRPFNLRHARSKLSVIALAELRPHDLQTGERLDLAAIFESPDEIAPQIVTRRRESVPQDEAADLSAVGNRILHPGIAGGSLLSLLVEAAGGQSRLPRPAGSGISSHVLASHAITPEAMRALGHDDRAGFLELRSERIDAATARLVDRHAEWDHSDRPSIAALSDEED